MQNLRLLPNCLQNNNKYLFFHTQDYQITKKKKSLSHEALSIFSNHGLCIVDVREFWKYLFCNWVSWLKVRLNEIWQLHSTLLSGLKNWFANFCTNPAGDLPRTRPVNCTPSPIVYVSLVYWAKFLNLILFYWYQAIRSQNINKNATQRNSLERNCSSSACGDPAGAKRDESSEH